MRNVRCEMSRYHPEHIAPNYTAEEIREASRVLRSIPSEKRAQASRDNGGKGDPETHKRGGRPRKIVPPTTE